MHELQAEFLALKTDMASLEEILTSVVAPRSSAQPIYEQVQQAVNKLKCSLGYTSEKEVVCFLFSHCSIYAQNVVWLSLPEFM